MLGRVDLHLVIVGGGIAALEAVLSLRELAPRAIRVTVLAPEAEFSYRPLAAVEPFGLGRMRRLPLADLAAEFGFTHVRDRLRSVEPNGRTLRTDSGADLTYGALLLATGARASSALAGALTYGGPQSNPRLAELLQEIRLGEVRRVVFAVPPDTDWPLPLYELALLTATRAETRGDPLEVAIATAERAPLGMFGDRASAEIGRLLDSAGIELRTGTTAVRVEQGGLQLDDGAEIAADRVVALPRFEVPPIPGIPQGAGGFIATDRYMKVEGTSRVWAAGDATWFPIKQGGIAAQQADVAARSIARLVDPGVTLEAFRPVLRAALLTGRAPWYLRAAIGDRPRTSAAGSAPLWWPPAKVAGRHLGPYLARSAGVAGPHDRLPELADVAALEGEELAETESEHMEALGLALTAADADARWRDFDGALRWLEVAEQINLTLPPEYERKREAWQARGGGAPTRDAVM
jgi:sulfide:quinone oxidoreductase